MENNMQTLADVIGGGAEVAPQTEAEQLQPVVNDAEASSQQPEPGYVQRRIQHALRESEAKYQAEIAALTNRVNALTEQNLSVQARERVAAGDFKNEELALKYLRMEAGLPVEPKAENVNTSGPSRDAQGRFTKVSTDVPADLQQRASDLIAQANTLREATGIDVYGLYESNPEIQQKVLSGEWDFKDVWKHAQQDGGYAAPNGNRAPIAPVRNPNGIGIGDYNIRKMDSASFAKLNEMLEHGGVIDMTR